MEDIYPKVTRMPIISGSVTCPFCGNPVRAPYVYSVDGYPWRCWDCLRKLAAKIVRLRQRSGGVPCVG